jgi:hypothetical protein
MNKFLVFLGHAIEYMSGSPEKTIGGQWGRFEIVVDALQDPNGSCINSSPRLPRQGRTSKGAALNQKSRKKSPQF